MGGWEEGQPRRGCSATTEAGLLKGGGGAVEMGGPGPGRIRR